MNVSTGYDKFLIPLGRPHSGDMGTPSERTTEVWQTVMLGGTRGMECPIDAARRGDMRQTDRQTE